ncbi:hypothetical protein FHL15_006025 [Xylaria flabelliformis]|uniref:Uncharacterized protein n=1 Tax=Xylaria flabelliformis TaxID=2512241 RepID=A0A553HYW6_9PEZI|nr:hypothetical protein FHL15_006025 [Xylaria flabelliformis]
MQQTYLFQTHNNVVVILIEHDDRGVQVAKLSDTRAGRGRDIGSDGYGLDVTVTLRYRLAEGHALGTRSNGIRGVFHVGAVEEDAVNGEQRCADPELAVRAVRGRFGADTAPVEFLEHGFRKAVFFAGGLDRGRVRAGQGLCGGAEIWNAPLAGQTVDIVGFMLKPDELVSAAIIFTLSKEAQAPTFSLRRTTRNEFTGYLGQSESAVAKKLSSVRD